jgi:hypothetical protein
MLQSQVITSESGDVNDQRNYIVKLKVRIIMLHWREAVQESKRVNYNLWELLENIVWKL